MQRAVDGSLQWDSAGILKGRHGTGALIRGGGERILVDSKPSNRATVKITSNAIKTGQVINENDTGQLRSIYGNDNNRNVLLNNDFNDNGIRKEKLHRVIAIMNMADSDGVSDKRNRQDKKLYLRGILRISGGDKKPYPDGTKSVDIIHIGQSEFQNTMDDAGNAEVQKFDVVDDGNMSGACVFNDSTDQEKQLKTNEKGTIMVKRYTPKDNSTNQNINFGKNNGDELASDVDDLFDSANESLTKKTTVKRTKSVSVVNTATQSNTSLMKQ